MYGGRLIAAADAGGTSLGIAHHIDDASIIGLHAAWKFGYGIPLLITQYEHFVVESDVR